MIGFFKLRLYVGLLIFTKVSFGVSDPDLVWHVPFDGSAKEVISGKPLNEHGKIKYVNGIVGKAAQFDGAESYVYMPFKTAPAPSGSATAQRIKAPMQILEPRATNFEKPS